jgi:hypothetical protein
MSKPIERKSTRFFAIWGAIFGTIATLIGAWDQAQSIYDRWKYQPNLSMQVTGVWNYAERGNVPMLVAHCLVTNTSNRKLALTNHLLEYRKLPKGDPAKLMSVPVTLDSLLMPTYSKDCIIPGSIDAGESKTINFVIMAGNWLKRLDLSKVGFRVTLGTDQGDFMSNWGVGVTNGYSDVMKFDPDTVHYPTQMDSFENLPGN